MVQGQIEGDHAEKRRPGHVGKTDHASDAKTGAAPPAVQQIGHVPPVDRPGHSPWQGAGDPEEANTHHSGGKGRDHQGAAPIDKGQQ
jgi:hypothetical protein